MRALSLSPFLTLLLLSGASTVLAQNGARGSQPAATAGAESSTPGASAYVRKVANGIRLAASRDLDGATSALREAVQDQPSSAMAYYYLGEVQRLRGDMDTALGTFERCTSFAGSQNDALYQARCMRGKADTLERMNGRREDARTAWNEYVRFADAHRQVSSPETGRARMQAIDAQLEQARAYIEVRQRIAERERVNASSGGGSQGGQGQGQRQRH